MARVGLETIDELVFVKHAVDGTVTLMLNSRFKRAVALGQRFEIAGSVNDAGNGHLHVTPNKIGEHGIFIADWSNDLHGFSSVVIEDCSTNTTVFHYWNKDA